MMLIRLSIIALAVLFASCKPQPNSFKKYYSENFEVKHGLFDVSKKRTFRYSSDTFHIDTIYRSMHGPLSEKEFNLADSGDLVWFTGYKVLVYDTSGSGLPLEFVCHNNLNLSDSRNFPWKADEWSYLNRVFTLSQGMTNVNLPDGFGVPLPGEQAIKVVFQALNHNLPDLDTNLYHEIEISYFLESEIDFEMKPLRHQNIWLVKQYEGPPGKFGDPVPDDYQPSEYAIYSDAQQPVCGLDELANNQALQLDLYWDNLGRKYTGHWKVPPGEEYLEFDASRLLYPRKNERIHYINAHIHPFCEYLELYDETDNTSIFTARVINNDNKTGIKSISEFKSEEGIMLYSDHKYVMKSKYNNLSDDTLSAMSVLYLYSALD